MGCTIFASDFHIGPGLGLVVNAENPHTWERLTVQGQRRLGGFLSGSRSGRMSDAVYLLGDIPERPDHSPPRRAANHRNDNARQPLLAICLMLTRAAPPPLRILGSTMARQYQPRHRATRPRR